MAGHLAASLAAVAGYLTVAAALTGQPLQETASGHWWIQEWRGEADPAPRVAVRSRGAVTVRGSAVGKVRYHLTTRVRGGRYPQAAPEVFDSPGIVMQTLADGSLQLALRDPACAGCRVQYRLVVEVPPDSDEISVETSAGSLSVSGIAGSVTARVNGGAILVDQVGGSVTAVTAGGDMRLGAIGGHVQCETAGGGIQLDRSGGSARLITSLGSIRADRVSGDLHAETGGGGIKIGRVDGIVRALTGGGLIQVREARNGMRAESGAGDIRIDQAIGRLMLASAAGDIVAGIQEGAILEDSELTTSTGAVVLTLPESLALTLDASIALDRGLRSIFSDFPSVQVRRMPGPLGPGGAQAVGTINGGGSLVRIRNGRGRIEIRRMAVTSGARQERRQDR